MLSVGKHVVGTISSPSSSDPSNYIKVFPSYAANPEKRQFSFRSPKSAILPSTIGKFDAPYRSGPDRVFRLALLFFFCLVWRSAL